jgi:hypothetical protein
MRRGHVFLRHSQHQKETFFVSLYLWVTKDAQFYVHAWPKCKLILKGQSHEKVGELRVWRGSLGPN